MEKKKLIRILKKVLSFWPVNFILSFIAYYFEGFIVWAFGINICFGMPIVFFIAGIIGWICGYGITNEAMKAGFIAQIILPACFAIPSAFILMLDDGLLFTDMKEES